MKPLVKDSVEVAENHSGNPRSGRIDVVVVSTDDGFLIELGPLFGDRYRTRPVDSPAGIAGALSAQDAPTLVVLDAGSLPDPRSAVALVEQSHPHLPIVMVAPAGDSAAWAGALSRGSIVALVQREQLEGTFGDALARAGERARTQAGRRADPPPGGGKSGSARTLGIAGAGAGAAAVALAGWFLWHHATTSPGMTAGTVTRTAASTAPAAPGRAQVKPQSVLDLLSSARIAFQDPKMQLPRVDGEPRGDSALELYEQVLASDPHNDEALNGMQRLFSVAHARIQADLTAGKLDEAMRLRSAFKSVNVDPAALREMDAAIAAARPKWLAAKAQAAIAAGDWVGAEQDITQLAPLDRTSSADLRRTLDTHRLDQQIAGLAASARAAIAAGSLIDPANDNARTRLQAMRAVNRNHPLTLAVQRELQAALIKQGLEQSHRQQFDAAQRYLNAAAEIAPAAEVTDARRQLQADMNTSANVQRLAAARAAAAALAARRTAAAPTRTASASKPVAQRPAFISTRPTRPLRVIYPAAAADSNVQGRVVVEFMLQPDGRALDPHVIESQPARIFDRAAVDAVAGGRFDARTLKDKTPQRARVLLTFKPS